MSNVKLKTCQPPLELQHPLMVIMYDHQQDKGNSGSVLSYIEHLLDSIRPASLSPLTWQDVLTLIVKALFCMQMPVLPLS